MDNDQQQRSARMRRRTCDNCMKLKIKTGTVLCAAGRFDKVFVSIKDYKQSKYGEYKAMACPHFDSADEETQ